jgi:hypothetical protein
MSVTGVGRASSVSPARTLKIGAAQLTRWPFGLPPRTGPLCLWPANNPQATSPPTPRSPKRRRRPSRMAGNICRVSRRGDEPFASNQANRRIWPMGCRASLVPSHAPTLLPNLGLSPRELEHCRRDAGLLRLPYRSRPTQECGQPNHSFSTLLFPRIQRQPRRLIRPDASHPSCSPRKKQAPRRPLACQTS